MSSALLHQALTLLGDEEAFAVPEPVTEPSWLTIIIAAVCTAIIIWATWSGVLF